MKKEELLAIGAALTKTVRKYIKYSENLFSLYRGHTNSSLYRSRRDMFQQTMKYRPYTIDHAYQGFKIGIGYCDGLCVAAAVLASRLDLNLTEKCYISIFAVSEGLTENHAFCIIHQDPLLHTYKDNYLVSDDIHKLGLKARLKNGVICDPWIYKSSYLSDIDSHLGHAKLYNVTGYYEGEIISKSFSFKIPSNSKKPYKKIDDFESTMQEIKSEFFYTL
ncbi:hypothetical protein [Piscirickettsia litoralis]|uniref:Transglutaminase-like domain-containing protein n=1 Tax=Piscirickettsia litoralis TaxID=1891921 RepID=A0ABX3A4K6_9GAMM|nr:hypothetical protein [Piscirickettsia litoralis]ODN42578.1 hypothetical protein BGC07_06075 [Piscirickettsia litoralis]